MVNYKHTIKFVPLKRKSRNGRETSSSTEHVKIIINDETIGDITKEEKGYFPSHDEWLGVIYHHIPREHSTFWKPTLAEAKKEARIRIDKYCEENHKK